MITVTKASQLPAGFLGMTNGIVDQVREVRDGDTVLGWIGKGIFSVPKRGTGMAAYHGGPWIPEKLVAKIEWLACKPDGTLWFSYCKTKAEVIEVVSTGAWDR